MTPPLLPTTGAGLAKTALVFPDIQATVLSAPVALPGKASFPPVSLLGSTPVDLKSSRSGSALVSGTQSPRNEALQFAFSKAVDDCAKIELAVKTIMI